MYVEISPRQSGKTTRLVKAASDYLRHNPTHNITIVGVNEQNLKELKNKFIRSDEIFFMENIDRIKFMAGNLLDRYTIEPDYWFFDEFGFMREEHVKHPIYQNVIDNAYYCTTPINGLTTNTIVDYCVQRDIEIRFNNPWTEERIQEQGSWSNYTREVILNDWLRYMESKGLMNGTKINLAKKEIRKHRFMFRK